MKPGIHSDYHPVFFQDADTGAAFLIRSTITSSRTIDWPTADRRFDLHARRARRRPRSYPDNTWINVEGTIAPQGTPHPQRFPR